jgi:general L-amino acid transport system substrate-binding protein
VNTGGTLAAVLGRGHLRCGVSGRLGGFSESQPNGDVEGFDADFCRAVAAAVFSDADAVEFVPLAAGDRFNAVATGDVDVLFRNTTWTLLRDSQLMVDFGPKTFYDGQKLMGRRAFPFSESSTTADLDGVTVCAILGSATERNLAQRAASEGITVRFVPVQDAAEVLQKFQLGACDVMTADGSSLIAGKTTNDLKNEWVIFPRRPLSREPLGPVYASNDSQWADIVNWVVFTTIIAESNNLSTANLSPSPNDAESARLLGLEGTLASDLGLANDALAQVIRQVGNYGEIYDRNLTRFGISRSGTFNELAEHGGLLYAPPVR